MNKSVSNLCCKTIQELSENCNSLNKDKSSFRIFKIVLSDYYPLVSKLVFFLNSAELEHAQRYHFEKDANRYIICRVLLKFILAQHTGITISDIHIRIATNKKPYLANNNSVFFNLSHSKDVAVIALSPADVGIDLEYLNPNFDFIDMLPSIYSQTEIETVLKAEKKIAVFYKFWTRKEAIVKATGQGISDNLPEIPATNGKHSVASHLLNGYKKLFVYSFNVDKDYIAAITLCYDDQNVKNLKIYNMPNTLETLLSFSSIKSNEYKRK